MSEEDKFKANADDDSNSIANQKQMLSQYCIDKGWEIYRIYSDDDFTGSDRSRPAFNDLLKAAEEHKFDVIVCKTQSRFTREIELVEKYINYLFPLWGVRFVSIVDNADTAVKGNKKARQINGLINEWYLEDMSENIKAVLTSRRRDGCFIGAFAPYGYKKDPLRKGHLIIDEPAAATVRQIFNMYLQGMGRTAIAKELNRLQIPTPTDYKIANGENYKNGSSGKPHLWRYFTIGNILTNEVYIGNLIQNKAHSISYKTKIVKPTDKSEWIKAENTHQPIIPLEVWNKAQSILNSRAKPAFKKSKVNIFSGSVFCSECGRCMRVSVKKDSTAPNGRRYLRCSTRYYSPDDCTGTSISYDKLCDMVTHELRRLCSEILDTDFLEKNVFIPDRTSQNIEKLTDQRKRLETHISETTACLKNLYIDKIKGVIDEDTYGELSSSFSEEMKADKQLLSEICEQLLQLAETGDKHDELQTLIRRAVDFNELSFGLVQMFVQKIVVHPKKPYSRQDEVDIHWDF